MHILLCVERCVERTLTWSEALVPCVQVSDLSAQLRDTLPAEQLLLRDVLRRLSPESTLRFRVEFHRFFTALSVLKKQT